MNHFVEFPKGSKNNRRNFEIFIYLLFKISVLVNNPG